MKRICSILLLGFLSYGATWAAEDKARYPALFERAAAEFNVPADVLKGIAFAETRWAHLTWPPGDRGACNGMPRPYGIMSLRDDSWFGHSLREAAALIGQSPDVLKTDVRQNLRGAAALLRKLHDQMPLPEGTAGDAIESWRNAIAAYCGIPQPDFAQQHALEVFCHMNRGYHQHGIEWNGRPVGLEPIRQAVKKIVDQEAKKRPASRARHSESQPTPNLETVSAATGSLGNSDLELDSDFGFRTSDLTAEPAPAATPDYPSAIWRSAYPGHWYTSGSTRAFVVIHDMEGYYWGTISYFQDADTRASSHYCVNAKTDYAGDSPPGEITQMVEERYCAWHASCWNSYMFGIEHEGFADDPAWFTEAQYQASARLVRYLCDKYNIPKDRNHIIAHGEYHNQTWCDWMAANWPQIDLTCQTHWDPGPNWNWTHYMGLIRSNLNDALVGSINVPTRVSPGETFTASITMQNIGTKAWTNDATPHRLGSQNPQDNFRWGTNRVALPSASIDPGQSATFTFTARAPTVLGNYAFDWRMVEESVEWFGETATATITVAWPPPAITNQPQTLTVNPGDTASFHVGATGMDPLTYQWRKEGLALADHGSVSGATSTTLVITNVQWADAGFYTIVITATNGTITSQEAQLVIAATPTPSGTGAGLRAWVFDNSDFNSLKRARIDATVNFDWGANSPSSTTDPDTFSVRWQGQVEPRYTQTYTFYARTDDGVRLWINGALLIDRWQNQSPTETSGTIALTAGQKYDLRMDYYENTGGAVAQLRWSSPSQAKEIIPQTQLYRPPPVLASINPLVILPGSNLTVAVTVSNWDPYLSSQPIADFEDYPHATEEVMFKRPIYSGSTSAFLDTAETNYTTVIANGPAGNASARVLKARWAFAAGAANPWLRLTTAGAPVLRNPTIAFNQSLWFDLYADRDIRVALGAKETGTTAAIGADGGTSGAIEFVGAATLSGTAPNPVRTVASNQWTTVKFDLPREPVCSFFNGNGVLESATGKGVLEHLAFVPASGPGIYRVYLDNFVVVEENHLTFSLEPGAPPGAGINPTNGVFTWNTSGSTAPGLYPITVRVTDSGSPALSNTGTFIVAVGVPPSITTQPRSLAVAAGSNAAFSVVAAGTAPLFYQWRFRGTNLPGETNPAFVRLNAQSAHAGAYSAVVSNSVGSVTSTMAALIVNNPPVLSPLPNRAIHAGSTVILTNTASDLDAPSQTLRFTLGPGAPAGATLDPLSGVFRWTSSDLDAGATSPVTVRVTDNGVPSLSDARTFTIMVVSRPVARAIVRGERTVTFGWTAIPGQAYRVQFKDNLDAGPWLDLLSVEAADETASATASIEHTQRFYRIVVVE